MAVGFVSAAQFVQHQTGRFHPERPDRIRVIHQAVRTAGLIESPNPFPEFEIDLGIKRQETAKLVELTPKPAELQRILAVHPQSLIDMIKHRCAMGGGVLDQGDTPVSPESYDTALLSAGGAIRACEAVMKGEAPRAFSAARPPGHHAEPERPMGFCLFSNMAIAARYAQQAFGVEKIAIVDFDVHHGNGTQAAFEADPSVLFISLPQHPSTCYPGSGFDWEVGIGAGKGYTLNIPLDPGGGDEEYALAFDSKVIPRLDQFKPHLLMISAGFDGHVDDPLANMTLTDNGFEMMTRKLVDVANVHCSGKIVSVLEGGYNLRALGRSVVRHLLAMT